MSPEEVDRLLAIDPAWRAEVRDRWRRLMDLVVWGELQTAQAGSLTRLRKRSLDLGERWRSFFNPRDWISQPRERLKNALGSALAVRATAWRCSSRSLRRSRAAGTARRWRRSSASCDAP